MAVCREASKVSATAIGLEENINMANARVVDHLTPRMLSRMNITLHSVGWRVDLSFSACLPILALSELGTSRLYFWSSDHLRNLCIIVCQYLCNVIPNSPDQVMQNKNLLRELPYFGHNIILCAMGNSTTSSRLIVSQLKSIWNVCLAFMTFIPFSFNSYAELTPFRPIRAYGNLLKLKISFYMRAIKTCTNSIEIQFSPLLVIVSQYSYVSLSFLYPLIYD